MDAFKRVIRTLLKFFNFELHKIKTYKPLVIGMDVDLVLDVGANVGQYALSLRKQGYRGRIVSFEPLSSAHAKLELNAQDDVQWNVFQRSAVGSFNGSTSIHISENSVSSSMMGMLSAHRDAAPESQFISEELTSVTTLDSVFDQLAIGFNRILLKIDTQGFENEVIEGARESLSKISAIQIELSLVPLYEGQFLYDHFIDLFGKLGFLLWDVIPGFRDPRTGQLLQFDGVFVRRGLANEV